MIYSGCAVSWLIALPLFVVGGGIALIAYAVIAEISETLTGRADESAGADAREQARP